MLGRSALLAATNSENYGNWLGNYSDVSLLLRNGTPELIPFDESPTPKTITTFGNASVTTAVARWNQGSGGGSLVFDGSGDYFAVANDVAFQFGTSDFTVECWVYLLSGGTELQTVFSTGFGSNSFGLIIQNRSTVHITFPYVAIVHTFPGALGGDNWYHLAISRTGTSLRCFVNGIQIGSTATNSANYTQGRVRIGIDEDGSSNFSQPLNGYIDDLRITKGIARYTSNFTPPTAELPANITNDPSYNSVSLLLRNGTPLLLHGTPLLLPFDESPTRKTINAVGNASVTTAVARWNQGSGGSSLAFDGNGDYLTFPPSVDFQFDLGDYTIEWWQYVISFPHEYFSIVHIGKPGNTASYAATLGLRFELGGTMLRTSYGQTYVDFTTPIPTLGIWEHYAVVRVSGISKLFKNGIQIDGDKSANLNIGSPPSNGAIGGAFFGGGSLFSNNGYIDDLRITKGIARYTSNFTPPTAELPNF